MSVITYTSHRQESLSDIYESSAYSPTEVKALRTNLYYNVIRPELGRYSFGTPPLPQHVRSEQSSAHVEMTSRLLKSQSRSTE